MSTGRLLSRFVTTHETYGFEVDKERREKRHEKESGC